jgi:hypothetical protein
MDTKANVKIVNTANGTITWFIYNANDSVEVFALYSGVLAQGQTYTQKDAICNGTGYAVNIHYNQEQKKYILPADGGTVSYSG